jgi:hypothetical protein
MQGLGALCLLLTTCLVASAGPVPTPPDDIQVQENFDVSRVRLAEVPQWCCVQDTGLYWAGSDCPGSQSPHVELQGSSPKGPPAQTAGNSGIL